jgi:hypothetical protein
MGVKHVLFFRQPCRTALEEVRRLALAQLQAAGIGRIKVLQPEALAFSDTKRADVLLYTVEDLFSWHAAAPFYGGEIYARWAMDSNLRDPPLRD